MKNLFYILLGVLFTFGCGEESSDDGGGGGTVPQIEEVIGTGTGSGDQSGDGSRSGGGGDSSGDDNQTIDPTLDSDSDGLTDVLELEFNSNPNDPDSDDDGVNDLDEYNSGLDPNNPDTDGDSLSDLDDQTPGTYTLKAIVDFAGDDLDGCYKKSTFKGTLNQSTGVISEDSSYNIYYSYNTLTGESGDSTRKLMIFSTSAGVWRLLSTTKVGVLQTHPNDFLDGDLLDYDFSTYGYNSTINAATMIEGAETADGSAITYIEKACFHIGDASDPSITDYIQFIELAKVSITSDQLILDANYHAFYAYDDGEYYLVAFNHSESKWQLFALGAVDPTTAIGGSISPVVIEDIGSDSKTLNEGLAPDSPLVQY